jgi:hypothetical protein
MSTDTNDSLGYEYLSLESDPINDLIKEICIVFANNTSFVARLIVIREDNELWFESKSGQRWMVARRAITSIRPSHHVPGGR